MFCNNCGTNLGEGGKFCPNCGAPVIAPAVPVEPAAPAPVYETPVYQAPAPEYEAPASQPTYEQPPVYQQPVYTATPVNPANPTPAMVWGIISCALSATFYLSFLGFIFSFIAKNKLREYFNMGGLPCGKAKTAHITSKIGFILGLVLMIVFIIWLIVVIVAAIAAIGSNIFSDFMYY